MSVTGARNWYRAAILMTSWTDMHIHAMDYPELLTQEILRMSRALVTEMATRYWNVYKRSHHTSWTTFIWLTTDLTRNHVIENLFYANKHAIIVFGKHEGNGNDENSIRFTSGIRVWIIAFFSCRQFKFWGEQCTVSKAPKMKERMAQPSSIALCRSNSLAFTRM
jgi:hypothetical protein